MQTRPFTPETNKIVVRRRAVHVGERKQEQGCEVAYQGHAGALKGVCGSTHSGYVAISESVRGYKGTLEY